MKITRIERVADYVSKETSKIIKDRKSYDSGVDALNCALDLGLDRANVSKDLNILWKEGKLIKIQGRPVFYLDYQVVAGIYPQTFIPSLITHGETIADYCNEMTAVQKTAGEKNPLTELIGADGSLREIITAAQAAVAYPPYGLHCLISGNPGTGKSYLANKLWQYACQFKKKDLPFITLDCQNYVENPQAFQDELLGYQKRNSKEYVKGALDSCPNGIILLEAIELLPPSCQSLLATLITTGIYTSAHTIGRELRSMLIMTTEKAEQQSIIAKAIPLKLELRDIDKRGVYEKIELILDLFKDEALRINCNMQVKKDVIVCLTQNEYPDNIISLHKEIQLACSKAYFAATTAAKKTVYVNLQHLSLPILSLSESKISLNFNVLNLLSCIKRNYLEFNADGSSSSATIFAQAPLAYSKHRFDQFVKGFSFDPNETSIDEKIIDSIQALRDCPDSQLQLLKSRINPLAYDIVLDKLGQRSKYSGLLKNPQLLYGILLHITNRLENKDNNIKVKEQETNKSANLYPEEHALTVEIAAALNDIYHFDPLKGEIDFLTSYFFIINQWANNVNVAILLILHGEQIATQTVDYLKRVIDGNYYLAALDFKADMQLNDCLELACLKCTEINRGAGVLILCDTEPLTSIGEYVTKQTRIITKTIADVSLRQIMNIINKSKSPFNNILSFENSATPKTTITNTLPDEFILQIKEKIIAPYITFLDLDKAIPLLNDSLHSILQAMEMEYDYAIGIKYLCHTAGMIERIIRNETWEFQKLNTFVRNNARLLHLVEHSLKQVSSVFSLKIPLAELAYVAQIFLLEIDDRANKKL